MKIRISLGLDLYALPLHLHQKYLEEAARDIRTLRNLEVTLEMTKATAIMELSPSSEGQKLPPFHLPYADLPRFDIYRWINISKEL